MADMNSFLRNVLVDCKETENRIYGYVDSGNFSIKDSLKSLGYSFSIRHSKNGKSVKQNDKSAAPVLFQQHKQTDGVPQVAFFGSPFTIERSINLQCSQGPKYYKKKITKPELCDRTGMIIHKKNRKRTSKKMDCPANMSVRCIRYYPDFVIVKSDKRYEKNKIVTQLKGALKSDDPPRSVRRFYISASKQECHSHPRASTNMAQEMDIDLVEKVVAVQNLKSSDPPAEENVPVPQQVYLVPIVFTEHNNNQSNVKSLQRMIREELKQASDASYFITDKVVLEKMLRVSKELNTYRVESTNPPADKAICYSTTKTSEVQEALPKPKKDFFKSM